MKKYVLALVFIILFHALILTRTIFFPYPEVFIYPYLTNQGLIPYKQIFDQHFPGLMFLPINFNNLGMTTPDAARFWLIGIVSLTHFFIFFFFLKIIKDPKKVIVANIVYLIWQPFLEGWVFWIEEFLPLFYIPAFYFSYKFLVDKRKNYLHLALVGFLLSLAVVFKQVALPLVGVLLLMFYCFEKKLKVFSHFLAGFLPVVVIVIFYFWKLDALLDMWFWTVWFNLTTFAKYGRKGPTFIGLIRALGVFSPSLFIPLLEGKELKILLAIFLAGSLAGAFVRFDYVHLQAAIPFIGLIVSLALFKLWNLVRYRIFFAGYFAVAIIWLSVFYIGHLGDKVFFFDAQTVRIADKIKIYSKPGEEIYLFGPVSHLYFLTSTIPAGRILVLQFPWFLMESEKRFLNVLKNNPPKLIVRDRTVVIEGQSITRFAHNIDQYIEENYLVFDKIGVTEFLRNKKDAQNRI